MSQQESTGWAGWAAFAGIMLIIIGGMHAIAGFFGILGDDIFVKGAKYTLQLDTTTWGWIHLIGGLIVLAAGFGVFGGKIWARTVGVIVAIVSIIINFVWLPWYPFWSIIMITIGLLVIWALTVHGRELASE
jgi:hypothetical protein